MMKNLIKKYHPGAIAGSSDAHSSQLTPAPIMSFEAQNALRFIAGYVLRKLYKNIQESSNPEKEGMASCIKEMIGSCSDEDDSDAWLKTIDRGGLWHVNQEVYALFKLIEEYFRHRFSSPGDYYEGSKDIITEELVKD